MSERMVIPSLELAQVEYEIEGKVYILVEASEAVGIRYGDAQSRAAKMQDGEVVGVDNIAHLSALLLSQCLYQATKEGTLPRNKDGDPDPRFLVAERTVRSWPSRVVKQMAAKAREISDLGNESREALEKQLKLIQKKLALLNGGAPADLAKNGHEPSPATSESAAS